MSRDAESRSRQRDAEASEREEKSKLQFQMERDALREKLRTTELQVEDMKAALSEILDVIRQDTYSTGPFKIAQSRALRAAMSKGFKAVGAVQSSNEKTV